MRISSIVPTISGVSGGYFARNAARFSACAASAAASRGGCGRNAATGPRLPCPGLRSLARRQTDRAAVLALRRVRDLAHDAARARVVLAHRLLAEIREAGAVDVHAVTLRRVERADDFARAIDVDHRGRPHAAERERRTELRVQLDVGEIVRPVVDPDVAVAVERQARHAAELPEVRQLFRPRGVEHELGHALRERARERGQQPGCDDQRVTSPSPHRTESSRTKRVPGLAQLHRLHVSDLESLAAICATVQGLAPSLLAR